MADRYVSYESLLLTDRAVRVSGHWLRVSTAGENPERWWLEFNDKKTAKRAGGSLLAHVREKKARRECNTDWMYNQILFSWMNQLADGGYIKRKGALSEDHEDTNSSGSTAGGDNEDSLPRHRGDGDGDAVEGGGRGRAGQDVGDVTGVPV